jgi:catechol 2,3-dioxygenase-like lactoylglutathione lyase family enzyme
MPLPIAFFYLPTRDLEASVHLFRDVLGHDELWREGDDTVGLAVPGSDVALMLDRAAAGVEQGGPGPMFLSAGVHAFLAEHPELEPVSEPEEIPGGVLASFRDPVGNWFYVLDQSRDG